MATNVKKYPPINKARYELLEVEGVSIKGNTIQTEWGLKGSEDGDTANVGLDTYIDWLDYKGHLQNEVNEVFYTMSFTEYWDVNDYNDRCTHMREYLATCASPIQYDINSLKQLAKVG